MATVELKRLVGQFRDTRTGKVRSVGWNMDQLFLDGKQIATINHVPGSPVGLMAGVVLSPAEKSAVENAIASERGGVKPSRIGRPIEVPGYELLDDDEPTVEEDTDVGEVGDE